MKIGYMIELVAYGILVVAGCLAGLAVARAGEVRIVRRPPGGALPWLAALIGLASTGVIAYFIKLLVDAQWGWYVAAFVVLAAMGLAVPACAAVAVPRQFGASLLAAWAVSGVAFSISTILTLDRLRSEGTTDVAQGPMGLYGLTMFALLVVAILLALVNRASQVEVPPDPTPAP